MKKSLTIILMILSLFLIGTNTVLAGTVNPKMWFIKLDEDNNKILDAEFTMYDLFGNNTFVVTNESNETESLYTFVNQTELSYDKVKGILNSEQIELIESIKTYSNYLEKQALLEKGYTNSMDFINDLDNTKGVFGYIEYVTRAKSSSYGETSTTPPIDYIKLTANNFVVLEETKAPIG